MRRTLVFVALAAGLTFRPLADTVRDTLAWDRAREIPRAEGVGLARERERTLVSDTRRERGPSARRRA